MSQSFGLLSDFQSMNDAFAFTSSPVECKTMTNSKLRAKRIVRAISAALLVAAAVIFIPSVVPQAQKSKDAPPKLTGVYTRKTASGEVVTLSADGPLTRTQTWQDQEGLHVILSDSGPGAIKGQPGGVRVRQVANSTEIVVPLKPGAKETDEPRSDKLDLVVDGNVDQGAGGSSADASRQDAGAQESDGAGMANARAPRVVGERRNAAPPAWAAPGATKQTESFTTAPAPSNVSGPDATGSTTQSSAPLVVPAQAANGAPAGSDAVTPANNAPPPAQTQPQPPPADAEAGIFSHIFSVTGLAVFLLLAMVAFLVVRRLRGSSDGFEDVSPEGETTALVKTSADESEERTGERRKRSGGRRSTDQQTSLVKASAAAVAKDSGSREQTPEAHQPAAAVSPALFGAYRVDQEVGKLVLGQPHRMDVLASRAPDDRRAMEASLLKAMSAPDADEDCCRRARQALEEYGFVARQSATLLLAHDDYERASAARTLGEIGSSAALPFLLEALYDTDAVVRTHAVASLGALKMPAAIGALLDMARRYPEMPASLLSQALSACSIECLDVFGTSMPERAFLSLGSGEPFDGEITYLEPASTVVELPEWMEDEALEDALERLQSQDVEARTAAAQQLAQFQVQRSVAALTMLASQDPEPGVRAAAVTSLGAIDHESVFAPVLIAFADEAREVRAAAARSLSRLNFDRADAYVRVLEMADADTLREVACACIKAGMASQAIDRLASEDRRQAYEAFSLLSLLARAKEAGPLLEAIDHHKDVDVRLAAVRLLGLAGHSEVVPQLRQLTVRDGMPEKVRMALLEAIYKMDQQTQPV
jgi:HEAT repeat protein